MVGAVDLPEYAASRLQWLFSESNCLRKSRTASDSGTTLLGASVQASTGTAVPIQDSIEQPEIEGIRRLTRKYPQWFGVTFGETLLSCFRLIQKRLADGEAAWSSPCIKCDAEMPWDWDAFHKDGRLFAPTYAAQPGQEVPETHLGRTWDAYRLFAVLRSLVRDTVVHDHNGSLRVLISDAELNARVQSMDPDQAFEQLTQPFAMSRTPSGELVRARDLTFNDEARLSFFPPPKSIDFGESKVGWSISVHPFLVHEQSRRAFFPVVAELLLENSEQADSLKRRAAEFWAAFFSEFEDALEAAWKADVRLPDWCGVLEGLSSENVDDILRIANEGVSIGEGRP